MKKIILVAIFILMFFCVERKAYAKEEDELIGYEIDDIEGFLNENEEYEDIDFKGMVKEIMTGTSKNVFLDMGTKISKNIFHEIIYNKKAMIKIIVLSILSALFTSFSEAFRARQIMDTGFFVTYAVIITVLVGSFLVITQITQDMVELLLEYMKVLLPSYVLSIGVAVGTTTGTGFYQLMLMLIMAVDYIFLKLMLPAIKLYVILILINNILKEDMMSKTTELIKTLINWCTRILLGVVVGINVVQSIVMPLADTVKGRGAYKLISLLPGVGTGAKTMTEIFLGSGIAIKNAIGIAGFMVIVCIMAVPVVKLLIFAVMYRITAAVIEPVTDKRIVKSISGIYTGAEMLIKLMCTVAMMFMISVVIICIMTNKII